MYNIQLSEPNIVSVLLNETAKQLIVTPLRCGQVKLELVDRCLMTDPAHLFIVVVSIGKIEAQLPDRVEKSKTIEAIVKLYDSLDNLLAIDTNSLHIYDLHEEIFDPETVSVKLGKQNGLGVGEIRYMVTGLEIGDAKIVFTSGSAGEQVISSAAVSVQVFSPLRLYPKNQTVIVGSQIQIYSEGGPHPDVNIVYTVQNDNVIGKLSDSCVV